MNSATTLLPGAALAMTRVARAVRVCQAAGVMDMNGHVSLRDENAPNLMWINSRKASRSTLTAADIVPVDLDAGTRIGAGDEPPSEFHIHREIYRRRPDVMSIVHSHPTHILALSTAGQPLLPATAIGSFLPEQGAPLFDSAVLINTEQRGNALAQTLGPAPVVVLRQHGTVTVGGTLEQAVVRMICAEDNARLLCIALQTGTPRYLRGEELAVLARENWAPVSYTKHWHYHEETAQRAGAFEGI
jgi:ribulose-5-phosphate 4-epimerase/fuculose-1-phosphate aldolase